jgi:NADH-quinone oxidoreductase subunit A
MEKLLLAPPVAFVIVLICVIVLYKLVSVWTFKSGKKTDGSGESYACGEDIQNHTAQPDYSQFFPFAFFFTIAHVAVMMVTTVPMESVRILSMGVVYIGMLMIGLYILLRK